MKSTPRMRWIALCLLISLTVPAFAITTVEVEVVCPICETKNKFYDYMSWGSYVYQYPSKFQLIFWPFTSSTTVYSCKKCHLSVFMWDFKDFPKDKIDATRELLEGVKLSGEYKTYTDIPVSEKLLIAEKIYRGMNRDDEFWSHFYRVLGYHLAQENKAEQAKEARKRALEVNQRMLADPGNEGRKKELLVIAGAMHHFVGDDAAASKELKVASALQYRNAKTGEEHSKNFDEYLSALIKEYISALEKGNVPADMGEARTVAK